MRSDTDRAFDDAFELGRRNAEILELARRHCLNMEFQQSGGRGMAEEVSGLPINTRQVRCPFGKPANSMAMNLEWIAVDFYEANCEGCPHRRPTGQLPNLATLVEERRAAQEQVEQETGAEEVRRHASWEQRQQQRRAMSAAAPTAMASALGDVGIIDPDPAAPRDDEATRAAIRRLEALAAHAPELFADDVVDHLGDLIRDQRLTDLLGPLRRLALRDDEYGRTVVDLAIEVLEREAVVEAARCLVDLRRHVAEADLAEPLVESLVMLAGRPERDDFGHRRRRSANNDPAGLRLTAGLCPEKVASVLRRLLRITPGVDLDLELPIGVRPPTEAGPFADFERCGAAGAIRSLIPTHPELVVSLVDALVENLRADEDDRFDLHPVGDVQRTIAVLFIANLGDVRSALGAAATGAGEEFRARLFGVLEKARWLVGPTDHWREPHDPDLDEEGRAEAFRRLMEVSFEFLSGEWGDEVAWHAAALIEDLAEASPTNMVIDIPAILGAFLSCLESLDAKHGDTRLAITSSVPPQLAAMEVASRQFRVASAASRLVDALEHVAKVDCPTVLDAVIDVMSEVKDTTREAEVTWRLLPLIGKVGRARASEPGVLRRILPSLHTYLVHSDQGLRAKAIEAWAEISSKHPLPSSLSDLLPVLTTDAYVVVIRSLLKAARRLRWNDADRVRLLGYAATIASSTTSGDETLKEALFTLLALTRDDDLLRSSTEALVLDKAALLERYDLRDVLRREWLPSSSSSSAMAKLRLAQALDPYINDRWNARDDEELTALLACSVGLQDLSTEELVAAALQFDINYPVQGAEIAEVAWRAARPDDALTILASMREKIPDQPVYADRISFVDSLTDAIKIDAREPGTSRQAALESAARSAAQLAESSERADDFRARLSRQLTARVRATALLGKLSVPEGLPPALVDDIFDSEKINPGMSSSDPVRSRLTRADALLATATAVEQNAQRFTPTTAYVRSFAGLCVVASHVLRWSAAELNAERDESDAHRTAALRRAEDLVRGLEDDFGDQDPLAGPMISSLKPIATVDHGDEAEKLLEEWSSLLVPLQIVEGPRTWRDRGERPVTDEVVEPTPVLVAVASIDDLLVTGAQVLRPDNVYTLHLEVRGEQWPEWADRLDAEFLSHLTQAQAQTPAFTWSRPTGLGSDDPFAIDGEGTLLIRFRLAAGRPAPPFLLTLRFRGTKEGKPFEQLCDVAGHAELRLRPFDATRDSLTQYRMVDERLLKLYDGLHGAGYEEDQVQAFCRLLTATCRAGMAMTWENRYRRGQRVSEREFHDDLFERLKADPELGGRLERGNPLGLGFLDVRHDGITSELKVERRTPVTKESVAKYIGQPTQYAAADGARLSILCILDMSPKGKPIATAENYLWQLGPAHHGLTNPEAPSIVTAVVVNAGLPTPSSWSRRRVETRTDERSTD